MKKIITWACLLCIFFSIASLFWYTEWKYSLPTPVPPGYHEVKAGENISLNGSLYAKNDQPLFLHFFNPGCPCSKFNIPYFKSLVKQYNGKVSFAIVVMSNDNTYTQESIQRKFGVDVPVYFDKSIATACGVYSTPQAALITANHTLYYRGNYNKSRYCSDTKSEFAKMAIDSLLNNNVHPMFDPAAVKSYGCSLPGCKKNS
jgi:hypothetical protein